MTTHLTAEGRKKGERNQTHLVIFYFYFIFYIGLPLEGKIQNHFATILISSISEVVVD
jgi:hypothetical protein